MDGDRKTFADAPIRVFTPLTPGDVCLALIGNGSVLFKGPTPMAVRKMAQAWRDDEMAKIAAREAAADKRKAALADARAAKRAAPGAVEP